MNNELPPLDIQEMLNRMAPPGIPDESLTANSSLAEIKSWHKRHSSSLLGGLQTDPAFHANDIRFDWLQRMILSHATGKKKPGAGELQRVLNSGLGNANVLHLEDPVEDTFCDLIATRRGNFRILLGRWEAAAAYTQTLLDAFEALPEGGKKADALRAAYALLAVSDEVCRRAGLDRGTPSGGQPMDSIQLPSKEKLTRLARHLRFSEADLRAIGTEIGELQPFILPEHLLPYVSDRPIGDTPLEFYPLMPRSGGVEVVSPTNLSIAARAALISVAVTGGVSEALQHRLLEAQERFSECTGFWPEPTIKLSAPDRHNLRASVCKFDHGQYLHIIQLPTLFDGWPQMGFASVRRLPKETEEFIASDIERFWEFLEKEGDCRRSATVLLMSGWGGPHGVSPPIKEDKAPGHWQYLPLSFADAAVLGACDDGNLRNILRVEEQTRLLERDGFTMTNPNGLINLFGYWRLTKGNFVPEHMWDITPPCNLMIGVDEILAPRLEALRRQDRRALPLPEGGFKVVQRKDWSDEDLRPIYASIEDICEARLAGAVSFNGRTLWIEPEANRHLPGRWQYQLWNAVLQWLAAVGPGICKSHPGLIAEGSYRISLRLPQKERPDRVEPFSEQTPSLEDCLKVTGNGPDIAVEIGDAWSTHLTSIENVAELGLIAAILEGVRDQSAPASSRQELMAIVRQAIGSDHWRWLHAVEPLDPISRLAAQGLVAGFKPVSQSAHALVKYGSVWSFRSRDLGSEISGEDACREFLKSYRDAMLGALIDDIRQFNRQKLAVAAARSFQAAKAEQSQWRTTIRALRSISGQSADEAAFRRHNECNAILRASKAICEIAACEARQDGGFDLARADMEELFAKSLLLFGNGQLFAAIRGGLIAPSLRISPGGDILSEREIFTKLLEPGAAWQHARTLSDSDARYGKRTTKHEPVPDRLGWDEDLRAAVEAEFGTTAEGYVDFQFAMLQLAEAKKQDVFVARHSELITALKGNPSYPAVDPSRLLKRLTLKCRASWHDGLSEAQIDLSRFDRTYSLINRPLLALDDASDPSLLVVPAFLSDSFLYSVSGLQRGDLNNSFWESGKARCYAGAMGDRVGHEFEQKVGQRLRELGLKVEVDCKLSKLLNEKVSDELGNIDVFALTTDGQRAWVVEAKDLRLCRTETEVAGRLSDFRGRTTKNSKGKDEPDKLLRHLRRVQYLRERAAKLAKTLKLSAPPEIKGLLVVDCPQPMNFHMLGDVPDAASVFLDAVGDFAF